MTSFSKCVHIDKLDNIVNKYSNMYNSTIWNVQSSIYIYIYWFYLKN